MNNKQWYIILFLISFLFSGCGDDNQQQTQNISKQIDLSNAKDGVYSAESSRDDKLGYSKLTLTIENHKIVGAEFVGYDVFDNAKGEDYGALIGGKDSADYKKAQIAVKANSEYANQLLETQSLDKVDAISGATVSYNQFVETVQKAAAESK